MSEGSRNLIILGALSIVIAGTTVGMSLLIYHNSGDIYLDRSRPGFLPDEEEISEKIEEKEVNYDFEERGAISEEVLDEYLDRFEKEIEGIERAKNAFSEDALSDERLGI